METELPLLAATPSGFAPNGDDVVDASAKAGHVREYPLELATPSRPGRLASINVLAHNGRHLTDSFRDDHRLNIGIGENGFRRPQFVPRSTYIKGLELRIASSRSLRGERRKGGGVMRHSVLARANQWTMLVLAIVLALVTGALAPSAARADDTADADQVAASASTAAEAAGAAVDSVPITSTADGYAAPAEGVVVPSDAAASIQINTSLPDPITLSTPEEVDVASGVIASDGSVSYVGHDGGPSLSITVGDGVLQQSVVIPDASSPSQYTFQIDPRLTPELESDGSVSLRSSLARLDPTGQSTDTTEYTVGSIASAWARDANGNEVPTRYEVDGSKLIQFVDLSAVQAFPVTADPSISLCFIWGWYPATCQKFTKTETKRLATSLASAGLGTSSTTAAALICGYVPTVAGKAVCASAMGFVGSLIFPRIQSAASGGNCIQQNIPIIAITGLNVFMVNSMWIVVRC